MSLLQLLFDCEPSGDKEPFIDLFMQIALQTALVEKQSTRNDDDNIVKALLA